MLALGLPPYTDDSEDRATFQNESFSDRQTGRWVFFNNGQKVIVVDSFRGIIHELVYAEEFSDFLDEATCYYFLPDTQHRAWIITQENPDDGASLISVYCLTFDYDNKTIVTQKEKDLMTPEGAQRFHPVEYIFKLIVYKDFITINGRSLAADRKIVMFYKLDDLLSKNQPDFMFTGHYSFNFHRPSLLDNRLYFFDRTIAERRRFRLQDAVELFNKLYYHDFGTKTNGEVVLQGSADCIQIDEQVFDRAGALKYFNKIWLDRRLFCCYSIQDDEGDFNSALMMLDLETRIWQPIELFEDLRYTDNPLMLDATNGVLIFTNTHIRNPVKLHFGREFDPFFIDPTPFENNDKSVMYRMRMKSPEKLVDLAWFSTRNFDPKLSEHLLETKIYT